MSESSMSALTLKMNRNDVRRYSVSDHVDEGDTIQLTVVEEGSVYRRPEETVLEVEVGEYLTKRATTQNREIMLKGSLDDGREVNVLGGGEVSVREEGERAADSVGELQSSKVLSKAE